MGTADIDVVNAADTGGGDAQGALRRISYPTPWVELKPQGWFEQLEGQKQTEGYSVRGGMWGGIRVGRSAGDIWGGHDSPSRCFGLSAEAASWVGGSVGYSVIPTRNFLIASVPVCSHGECAMGFITTMGFIT